MYIMGVSFGQLMNPIIDTQRAQNIYITWQIWTTLDIAPLLYFPCWGTLDFLLVPPSIFFMHMYRGGHKFGNIFRLF